jgi:hypothetical protein
MPRVRKGSWYAKGRQRLLVLDAKVYVMPEEVHDTGDIVPCMLEGYLEQLRWLSSAELRKHWHPFRPKPDLTYAPSWIKLHNLLAWKRHDFEGYLEVLSVRPDIGWAVLTRSSNEEGYSPEERQRLKRANSKLAWSLYRYTTFFVTVSDIRLFGSAGTRRTAWDHLMDQAV